MKSGVTMRDIADKLGISVVTVSKALSDKEGVSEDLKLRIKELASDMGYRLNVMAKAMKEGYTYNIGVVIAERFTGVLHSFYQQFHQQIVKSLEEYHYSAILHILSSEDEEQLVMPWIYQEKKVDGFIILGHIHKDYIEMLLRANIPVVFLDFYTDHERMDTVNTDNFYAMYEMTNYLINSGHRKIAFVGNRYSTSSIQDRFLGYYKSLLEHHIILDEQFIINDRDDKGRFIDILLPDDMPTAFVCNCDRIAYELMLVLKQNGYKVPDDCSVVGFDNDIFSTLCEPKLTTVEVNMPEMARVAAKVMMKKVMNRNLNYGRVLIKGKIIHRNSVNKMKE